MAKVMGQYRCGCGYGPIEKNKRLNYCGVHGDDIQDEYPYLSPDSPLDVDPEHLEKEESSKP